RRNTSEPFTGLAKMLLIITNPFADRFKFEFTENAQDLGHHLTNVGRQIYPVIHRDNQNSVLFIPQQYAGKNQSRPTHTVDFHIHECVELVRTTEPGT